MGICYSERMENLIQYLASFNPAVKGAQYACGGNWESATKIDLDNPSSLATDDGVDATVAIEIFYELNDKRMVFLGLRYSEVLKLVSDPQQFLLKVLETISYARQSSLEELVKLLGEALNDDAQTCIKAVQYVELGVEGYWKSEGSLVLRKATDPTLDEEALASKFQKHGNLLVSTKNHTALEFAIDNPEAWIGVQVSGQEDGNFKTDLAALGALANLI